MDVLPAASRALVAYLLLPVIGIALGGALWRLWPRQEPASLSPGARLALGLIALLWLGVILAGLGILYPWLLGGIVALVFLAALLRPGARSVRQRWPPPSVNRGALAGGLLMLCAAVLMASPAETFMVTDDAAVYTLGAVHLAQTGSLTYDDAGLYPLEPDRTDLPAPAHTTAYWDALQDYARQFLLPENVGLPAGTRFWGPFFQPVLYRQQVEIGYVPLTKVAGALFGWVLGERSVIWAGPALTLLALAAFLGLLRRSGGWGLAVPAAAMLAFSFPQVWFGRQLLSEPLTQALILGALWLDTEASATEGAARRALRAAEALALGLLPLARLEGALLAAILLVGLVWYTRDRRSVERRYLWLAMGAVAVGQVIALLVSPAYLYSRLIGVLSGASRPVLLAGLVAVAVGVAIARVPAWRSGALWLCHWLADVRHRAWIATVLAALYLVLVGWSLLALPLGETFAGWLALYWTRPALILAIVGLCCAPWLRQQQAPALPTLCSAGVLMGLLFAANRYVTQVHPWGMRRAVPLLLPALAAGDALALSSLATWLQRRLRPSMPPRSTTVSYLVVMSVLIWGVAQRTLPLVTHHERQGMWDQLAALDDLLAPHSVLLLDDGQVGRQIGQALALIYGHAVYNIQDTEALAADSPVVSRLIATSEAQGRTVYWLNSDTARRWAPTDHSLRSVGGAQFDIPVLSSSTTGPPTMANRTRQTFLVDVYQLTPVTAVDDAFGQRSIPLAVGSYPYLVAGFGAVEQASDGHIYRWTAGSAQVELPWPGDDRAPITLEVSVIVSGARPTQVPNPTVSLWAEGQLIAQGVAPDDEAVMTLQGTVPRLTDVGQPPLEIELRSDVFVPSDYGLGADERALGVQVLAITLSSAPGDPE